MISFKQFYLLNERVEETDIIDLYIMMALEQPDDSQYKAIYDEKFMSIANRIKVEIQYILLRELRHAIAKTKEFRHLANAIDKNHYTDIAHHSNIISEKIFEQTPDTDRAAVEFGAKIYKSLVKLEKMIDAHVAMGPHKSTLRGRLTFDKIKRVFNVPWDIKAVYNTFNNLDWYQDYGGKNWANVTLEAEKVLNTNDIKNLSKNLDRFIDFVHNTGSVAEKFTGHDLGWFPYILDLKAQSQNIRELMPYASYEIRQMMRDPSWRLSMFQQQGLGADKSDSVVENLVRKYFPEFTEHVLLDGFERWGVYGNEDIIYDDDEVGTAEHSHHLMNKVIEAYGPERTANALLKLSKEDGGIRDAIQVLSREVQSKTDIKKFARTEEQAQFLRMILGVE